MDFTIKFKRAMMKDTANSQTKAIRSLLLLITLVSLLTACTMTPPSPQQSEGSEVTPKTSETAIPLPTPTLTPTPRYQVNEPGDAFTAQQEAINNSQSASAQKARIQIWLDYWINFDNRPFAQESTELHWKYVYDNDKNPEEILVLLEAGGEYGGKLFTSPLMGGVFAEFPPEYDGGEIETGFGPLELSAGAEGQWLSVQDSIPVRRDAKNQIVEKLDMSTGLWKEVSLIEGNIFFDPQSEADFDKVVESPSPIDEPEKFAAWQDEYLKIIEEKLKNYSEPVMKIETSGIMFEAGLMGFDSNVWPVVGSYRFEWQGKNILTKTYVIANVQGVLSPLSVTYTTSDSTAFNQDVGYKTPIDKATMYIRYEWERAKDFGTDNFIDEYLPNRDENSDLVHWRKFMTGMSDSIKEDRDRAYRTRFVFVNYQ